MINFPADLPAKPDYMSRVDVANLKNANQFKLIAEIAHKDLVPFINEYYWRKRSLVVMLHYLFTIGSLAAWIWVGLRAGYTFSRWLETCGFAVIAFVFVVPVHEAIHGVAYKLLGAPDVRFSVSLKKFYAYAIADKFVVDRRSFALVAAMPFVLINGVLIIASLVLTETHAFFAVCFLLVHTGGTSGDWAMLNYLWLNRDREVYTYDDADEGMSYFYQRADA